MYKTALEEYKEKKNKQTQREFVLEHLKTYGWITRNYCLSNYISRLGAIICQLKKEGYDIEARHENGDYKYFLNER